MKHTVSYRNLEGDIIKDKKFNTFQEAQEEHTARSASDKILLNNIWYTCHYWRKIGSEFIIGVREV